MAIAKHHIDDLNSTEWLTPEESWSVLDYQARQLLRMSGEEFVTRWNAGEFDELADAPGHRHIMFLSFLIPSDRQITR